MQIRVFLWLNLFALWAILSGCTHTSAVATGMPRPARPENCELRIMTAMAAMQAGYELIGGISMTAPAGTNPLDDSIRKRVQPKACALGGEVVSLGIAGGGTTLQQGISFSVWARPTGAQPSTWSDKSSANPPPHKALPPNNNAAASFAAPPSQEPTPASLNTGHPPSALPPADAGASATGSFTSPKRDGIPVAAVLGFSSNDLGLGLGVRGGKTFTSKIYVGGTFVYHLGTETSSAGYGGYESSASFSAFYLGPEAGYEFELSNMKIRAYAGMGIIWLNASATTTTPTGEEVSADASTNRFVIWPGATLLYELSDSPIFVGGDLRFVTVPDGPAVGFFAMAGMHL